MATDWKRRMVADRYRRIWAIVTEIAEQPGRSRRELADRFHLSERQLQSDLNIIRDGMKLPLVRKRGYRFVSETGPDRPGGMSLKEAQLLVAILGASTRQYGTASETYRSLLEKLPSLFAPHLAPLVTQTLAALAPSQANHRQGRVVAALAEAIMTGKRVRLDYAPDDMNVPTYDPIIQPELLLPYQRSWYVVGAIASGRSVMLPLDNVVGTSAAYASRQAAV
jgi:predicted DNA-binding transcriptional regulator YafY